MKSIYFPNEDFLQAKTGNSPSWGWRSILEGRDSLKKGLIWKVGNGEKINIWQDNWLPSSKDFKIQSQKPEDCRFEYVSDLIDSNTRTWKMAILDQLFSPIDKKHILNIQLGLYSQEDHQCWGADKSGKFSVKSMYHLLRNIKEAGDQTLPSCSRAPHNYSSMKSFHWQRIWKAKTLPKIKNLMWKCAAEGIGSGENLARRNIPINSSCGRCEGTTETFSHLFFHCPISRAVWFGSNINYLSTRSEISSMKDWLDLWNPIFKENKKKASDLFSYASFLFWYIWKARNDGIFKKLIWTPEEVIAAASLASKEFYQHNIGNDSMNQQLPANEGNSAWQPPPSDYIKINCDGAWNTESHQGGIGIILRNSEGKPIHGFSSGITCSSSMAAEAMAIRSGLLIASNFGLRKIQVETDCLELLNQILSKNFTDFQVDPIGKDIVYLEKTFESCIFSFIPRSANNVADSLAKAALSDERPNDWPGSNLWIHQLCKDEIPACNRSILQ